VIKNLDMIYNVLGKIKKNYLLLIFFAMIGLFAIGYASGVTFAILEKIFIF